jgi:hypothetical protein
MRDIDGFCEELSEVSHDLVPGAYKTRDGIGVHLACAISCSEVRYSENSWNKYDPEVRCDTVIIGYTDGDCNHVVIAPYGKDNHCNVFDAEQLDDHIYMLQVYRKYMGKLP